MIPSKKVPQISKVLPYKFLTMAAAVAATIVLSTSIAQSQGSRSNTIEIDGSSTVFPITEAVAEEFMASGTNVRVTVGVSGTGGGFKRFCAGETHISDASRPIKSAEAEECKKNGIEYIELPIAFDALTVVVNKQNSFVDYLTVAELRKMWEGAAEGKITKWQEIRSTWPNRSFSLFGPGTDSGTFDYFNETILGKDNPSRGDYTASEDDNVLVLGVAGSRDSLGYFGYSYYVNNQDSLKAVPIVNSAGQRVMPSEASVLDGTYNPLSRPLFIYVKKDSSSSVSSFVNYYLNNVKKLLEEDITGPDGSPDGVPDIGYIPLPQTAYDHDKTNFASRHVGTVFGRCETVGAKVEDLLRIAAGEDPEKLGITCKE